ncbi:uncharacterized protein LOC109427457 [Aedes albopictus]|uniref:Secreted protein n=1 Tax=Aedes albopictus TaxID=7160 RepID=A0ABM1YBB6_AEDAL
MSDPLVEKATQIVLAMASALLLHDSETVRELYDGINQSLRGQPISDSAMDRMEQSGVIHMHDHSSARHGDSSSDDFQDSGTVYTSSSSSRPSQPRSYSASTPMIDRSSQRKPPIIPFDIYVDPDSEDFSENHAGSPMVDRTSQRKPPNQVPFNIYVDSEPDLASSPMVARTSQRQPSKQAPFEIYVDSDPEESYRSFQAPLAPVRLADLKVPPPETPSFKTLPYVSPGRQYLTVPEPHHMRNPNLSGGQSPRSPRRRTEPPADNLDESINTLVQRIHRQAEVMLARERSISSGGRGSNTPRRG